MGRIDNGQLLLLLLCQGECWALIWASNLVTIVDGNEWLDEVGPSSKCFCFFAMW